MNLVPYKLENSKTKIMAHSEDDCIGSVCPLHNRTEHSMRGYPQHWRGDRGLMERLCDHGIGHPDPDHITVVTEYFGKVKGEGERIHGCDGCCCSF